MIRSDRHKLKFSKKKKNLMIKTPNNGSTKKIVCLEGCFHKTKPKKKIKKKNPHFLLYKHEIRKRFYFYFFYERFFTFIKEDIILKKEVSFGFTTNNLRFVNVVLSMFIKKG